MDIESDDSERWEDFFGSSTELAPSLLGIYDSLTSKLVDSGNCHNSINGTSNNDNHSKSSSNFSSSNSSLCQEYTLHHSVEVEEYEAEENVVDFETTLYEHESSHSSRDSSLTLTNNNTHSSSNDSNCSTSNSVSSLSPTNSCSSSCNGKSRDSPAKHRNNIRVLSPNVQRIITHSDAEPIEAIDIDALQQQQQQPPQLLSPVLPQRFVKKHATTAVPHKLKLSHIPLSKITGKLTQSGNELVETFDSSCEYLDALNFSQSEKSSIKKPPTPAILPIPTSADDEKTPTNPVSPFNFDSAPTTLGSKPLKLTLPKQDSLKLIEMEQLDTQQQENLNANVKPAQNNAKEFVATSPLDASEMVEAINFSLVSQSIEHLRLGESIKENGAHLMDSSNGASTESMNGSTELIEAINKPLISKPLVRSVSAACASTIASSPLLTYARAKSLAVKANTLGGAVPIKLPTAEQLAELEEASQMSAESLDRLTDIKSKFSPKESRKISGLMLPDIAKLKHRPLSSSSICSTSSSSSSGSDHLNGKHMTTSYLASVESLADQSENELIDPHSGMSVFERACMEIVDSERSYVEDLGQVIRGYLLDWKERACLRYDELRILFANIEEIYDFNSTLLKQLINSGMDPVKIAKCFIDLRERFDVYTTYCTSYPEAISLLTRLLQATHTNSLLTSTQKMLKHTLPLGSYLLKPVQRITKYHLLLDNLRKHCDVKEVFQAHEIMLQVARNINQVKRKQDKQSRVKELSGILDGWLGPELTVLGELRHEGLLLEHNKSRMVFLFGTMLIITKPKEDNRLQFKSYIHQNNLMLSEHLPGEPTSFYVIPYDEPRNQIKLTAKNRDLKRLWAQHIKGVILEKFDNIPNRAKELVYKLGDEEDRTPDKNTWKWSLHSTSSTPVYLERRNQYRRSEMRNRSKMKRKTVANSSSFESFNEAAELIKDTSVQNEENAGHNKSMDDNLLPSLALTTNKCNSPEGLTASTQFDCSCEIPTACKCLLRNQRSSAHHAPKSPIFGGKALKERSKSVPRISFQCDDFDEKDARESFHGSNTNLDARKSKSSKSVEIKQYSTKTIPKRIATLKKQRSKKETSKFYMDLNEFETNTETVLKITESTENLVGTSEVKAEEMKEDKETFDVVERSEEQATNSVMDEVEDETIKLTPAEKAKKDAQIILELLKNNKEFERLGKKPQKKRFHENSSSLPTSPETVLHPKDFPPRPPSKSPPPLESDGEILNGEDSKDKQNAEEEPIYETLLRNVHVPYKFSPVLGRSNTSSPYFKPRDKKSQSAPRPESDYVTLVYSAEGTLQQVGEDAVIKIGAEMTQSQRESNASSNYSNSSSSSSSTSTLKRDSQTTVVSVDLGICVSTSSDHLSQMSTSTPEAIYARPIPKNLMKRLLSSATLTTASKSSMENVSSSENSLTRGRKSIDSLALSFGRFNKPPERRVSDVTEMCRQSIIHRQGSESVGERMAHVDYADPRTLFNIVSMNSSDASLQRDSVFSLTSSDDSVCDGKRNGKNSLSSSSTKFQYEDNVEALLETDFRDSAIYSDDNDKRTDNESVDYVKRPSSPPPPPPPPARNRAPQLPPKPTAIPPPAGVKSPVHQKKNPMENWNVASNGGLVIVCPSHMNQSASRSWVLQQIENFNK